MCSPHDFTNSQFLMCNFWTNENDCLFWEIKKLVLIGLIIRIIKWEFVKPGDNSSIGIPIFFPIFSKCNKKLWNFKRSWSEITKMKKVCKIVSWGLFGRLQIIKIHICTYVTLHKHCEKETFFFAIFAFCNRRK